MSNSVTSPQGSSESIGTNRTFWLGMTRYQWIVLFAAWLGWGFDVYDGLIFNYVSSNCIPTLFHLRIGSPEAKIATVNWTGWITCLLLVGWAIGGMLFGKIADRIGRTRTLMLTMIVYSIGTAACAFAPNIYTLLVFRLIASLGIGGEWAAGAAIVSEVVPEKRRVEAGALLYTAAPFGLFVATSVNGLIAGRLMAGDPEHSWRYIFATGLVGAIVAFAVRYFVKEPERWKAAGEKAQSRLSDLFSPENRHATFSGFAMAIIALIAWWSCNAFIPLVAKLLAAADPRFAVLHGKEAQHFQEGWVAIATNCFNLGGLIGTLLTIPAAKLLGRKVMFFIYYLLASVALLTTFSPHIPGEIRLYMYFFIGLTVFGVYGSFTFYLPELFPTRLRGTGAGFCYNAGRLIAALGPFWVARYAVIGKMEGPGPVLHALFMVGFVPMIGLFLIPFIIETKGRVLGDLDATG